MYAFWSYSAIHSQGRVVHTNDLLSRVGWLIVVIAYAKCSNPREFMIDIMRGLSGKPANIADLISAM